MPGNITAYEWAPDATMHIAYQTSDNHIHEMVGRSNGTWFDRDITRTAGGPLLESAQIAGFSWQNGHMQQNAYVSPMDSEGQIHKLVQLQNHNWSYEQPPGTPPTNGLALAGYDWKAGGSKQIVYLGLDGRVRELAASVRGEWQQNDLTQITSSPPAEAPLISAFAFEAGQSKHVGYISGAGHVHELMLRKGDASWHHTDLTAQTGAPLADGATLAGFGWERGRSRQFVYTGSNGNIYELSAGLDGRWRYLDLMNKTSAPLANGTALSACAWETGGAKLVVYVTGSYRIQELQGDEQGNWTFSDLTQLTHASRASNTLILVKEWTTQFAKQIIYLDLRENPSLHTLIRKHGENWRHSDLTALVGAQPLV